jgi:general secretion pathway protein I
LALIISRYAPRAMRYADFRSNKGFTLMEVLVAVAILGIGLGILLELFSGGLRSAKISEEVTKAQWFGKVKMEELLNARDLSEGVTEDTFDSQFSWKSEVTKNNPALGQDDTAGSPLPVDLYKIIVKVNWRSGLGQRSLELESLRAFKPSEETK